MSFEPREYLRHMLVEADFLIGCTRRVSREEFLADETLRRAFARSIEVVGEAAKQVPGELRDASQTSTGVASAECEID